MHLQLQNALLLFNGSSFVVLVTMWCPIFLWYGFLRFTFCNYI